ncbi:MAG TPA: radical SAM protein [Candidatus Binataceae bacterium]
MSSLLHLMNEKAARLGIPLSAHLDVTWRCNERCVHCYLDHDDLGELTYDEIHGLLAQMAEAGVMFLTLSGGEPFLRKDLFAIIRCARELTFNVKLKSNALLIREAEAAQIRELGVEQIQISIYSHRAEVHDAITKVKGSLERTLAAIRFLKAQNLKVTIANVVMRQNRFDYPGVQALAAELGVHFTVDPTISPHINGDRSLLKLNIPHEDLRQVLHDPTIGGEAETCAPPPLASDEPLDGRPCSAGHSSCYISPYGDVYPCVQFPLPSGNIRELRFADIWNDSPQLKEVRSIRERDLPVCSSCSHITSCTRCPGLAYMEGNMRGPSTADCEKSYALTGVPSANMHLRAARTGVPVDKLFS